jgi:hypothetical protein
MHYEVKTLALYGLLSRLVVGVVLTVIVFTVAPRQHASAEGPPPAVSPPPAAQVAPAVAPLRLAAVDLRARVRRPVPAPDNPLGAVQPAVESPLTAPEPPSGEPAAPAPEESVEGAVARQRPSLGRCYARQLKSDPTLTRARLSVRLLVDRSGAVSDILVTAPEPLDELATCLRATLSHWQLPPATADYQTEFPLLFQANGGR